MKRGRIKFYAAGQGVITPDDGSADVFFLDTVVHGGVPTAGAAVKYELYLGGEDPEAEKVVFV